MISTLHAARARDLTAIGVVAHWISLAVAFVILLEVNRGQWFNADEWAFLVDRHVVGTGGRGLWEPHNEHWSTIPILMYRGLFSVFGVRTYVPYLLVLLAVNLATAHLLWRLLRRVGVHTLLATGVAFAFALLGAGWENLTAAFQMSLLGSLALGLLALLLLPERGSFGRTDVYVVGLLVASLMTSGVGVTMTAVVTLAALLARGWRTAAAIVVVPAALYAIWFTVEGRHAPTRGSETFGDIVRGAPGYVWRGLTDLVDRTVGLTGAGAIILVLLVAWLARAARPSEPPWPLVVATASGAVAFLGLVSLRRQTFGIDNAGASRYAQIVIALLLPAAVLAAQRLLDGRPLRVVLLTSGVALLTVVAITRLYEAADGQAPVEQEQRQRVLAAAELLRAGEDVISRFPVPLYSPDLEVDDLEVLDRDGKLPGAGGVTETDRLTARVYLQVALESVPLVEDGAPPSVVELKGVRTEAVTAPGCVRLVPAAGDPSVVLDFAAPGSVEVQADRSGPLFAWVLGPDGTESRPREFQLPAGGPRFVNVGEGGFGVRLQVPLDGSTLVCGVAPGPDQV